ncbi:MAG TPA: ATP-binding protein, partial [Opitutus sp.]|nr:ATP-binding protein [Opitutus sp.]
PYFFTFESEGVVWMHSERRLERYDPRIPSATPAPLQAIFTQVKVPGTHRSLFPSEGKMPELDYSENSLLVHFSAPGGRFNAPVTFEVNLEGADTSWTSTGSSGSAAFNHLKEGHYTLRVRPRTDEIVGKEAVLDFAIRPPWYRTNLAYAGYALSGLGLLVSAAWISSFLERRENTRLEKLVAIRTQELNASRDRLAAQVAEIGMLSQAIEQSPVSVFITELDGKIVFANPRACETTGYSSEELVSRRIETIRAEPALTHKPMIDDGNDVLPTGKPWRGQLVNRHKDGRIVHVRTMIAPIRTPDGSVRHQVILEEDITEWLTEQDRRRKLEAQLFQAQKLESIGTLAGGIAHDFNNILTGILGYCELARLAARGHPRVIDELREVFVAGMRAKELVTQILTFSRKSSLQLVCVDLAVPVSEGLKLIRASTPTSTQIVSRIEHGWVHADATQIQQVVLNLCTNAIHAMKDRCGVLTVTVQRITVDAALAAEIPQLAPGAWMRLCVADNGKGMDATTLDRMFDPFFTTKRQGEGTGLGLSIVQGIVSAHKGALRVRSHPETGTIFEIYFGLTSDERPAPPVDRLVPQGAKQEIMVVDDERAVAKFASTRLQQIGYTTTMFCEPLVALAAFTASPQQYQAIVTDLTMPDLTGLELIERIRAQGRQIPAVIITGYGSDSVLAGLDAMTRCIVLQKPFSGDELATALDRVMNQTNGHLPS